MSACRELGGAGRGHLVPPSLPVYACAARSLPKPRAHTFSERLELSQAQQPCLYALQNRVRDVCRDTQLAVAMLGPELLSS